LDDKLDEFKRNGLRSTTGGRLGWSKEVKYVIHCLHCLFKYQTKLLAALLNPLNAEKLSLLWLVTDMLTFYCYDYLNLFSICFVIYSAK